MGGSSDGGGVFEFDQLSGSTGEDPSDEADQPDPPDDEAENAPERAASSDGRENPDPEKTDAGEDDDPPDPPDGTSNEPSASTTESDSGASTDGSTDESSQRDGTEGGTSDEAEDDESGDDAPDPPDPSDGGSTFYEFDPVDESQKAFQFAEEQSRAAAESAYKHAAESLVGRFVKKYTSPEVRQRLDEVFSRRMLGSVFVGGAFSKILESSIEVYFGASSIWRPVMWLAIFSISTIVFVWWEHLARRASEAAEKASETAEKASEAASEAAEKASETAEKASEAAKGESPESETAEVVGAGVTNAVGGREGGASAATRAGGKRPTAVRSRVRETDRRPNQRFENGAGGRPPVDDLPGDALTGDDLPVDEGHDDENESITPAFEGTGFRNPGDAE